MRRLLARKNQPQLESLALSQALLAFDFDGTLAPIVGQRHRARMRPKTARLFAQLCRLYPCAVISGRARADVAARLGRAAVKYVVGSHGADWGAARDGLGREMRAARRLLEATLSGHEGVELEDKRYSLAVHYRAPERSACVYALVDAAVRRLPFALRVTHGKRVVNVVSSQAPNKGNALCRLRAAARADRALYVGDDLTDEDVFRLRPAARLVTVRVGASRHSAAAYFLSDQEEIDRLLARLLELRQTPARS